MNEETGDEVVAKDASCNEWEARESDGGILDSDEYDDEEVAYELRVVGLPLSVKEPLSSLFKRLLPSKVVEACFSWEREVTAAMIPIETWDGLEEESALLKEEVCIVWPVVTIDEETGIEA